MASKPPFVSRGELETRLREAGIWTSKLELALQYAYEAHKDQKRDQGNAYLEEHIYPMAAGIVERHRSDPELEDIVTVAVLHDVIEDDPSVSNEEIEDKFGREILADVLLVTKKPAENTDKLSEEEKRIVNERMLANLEHASRRAQIVKLEDRYNNLSSFGSLDRPKYVRYAEEARNLFIPFAKRVQPLYVELFEKRLAELN